MSVSFQTKVGMSTADVSEDLADCSNRLADGILQSRLKDWMSDGSREFTSDT